MGRSHALSDAFRQAREGVSDIDEWRNRPLGREYAYLFMDGVWHKRCWGGGMENASVETIYQAIYLQARGELKQELKRAMRQGRTARMFLFNRKLRF